MRLLKSMAGALSFVISSVAAFNFEFTTNAQSLSPLTSLYSFDGDVTNGEYPIGALVQGRDGNFYGTTSGSGDLMSPCQGTIFKITPSGALTTLYIFPVIDCYPPNGGQPMAGLVEGSDGNFYGTTCSGGEYCGILSFGGGTVFKVDSNGNLTNLWNFTGGSDGACPMSALVQGSDGYLYGSTTMGGISNGYYGFGTIFKISTNGVLTTIYSFTDGPNGAGPTASALVQGSDGYFYGTTCYGGEYESGTVFKFDTTDNSLTTLWTFTGGSDGAFPYGLVQGTDGDFYGTCAGGGLGGLGGYDWGTAFKITPSGDLANLYSFGGSFDGGLPEGPLIQGNDGNFYGACHTGGWVGFGLGTVFVLTPEGALTTLYAFSGLDGGEPTAGPVQGSDGNLYGTTTYQGTNGVGTFFKMFSVDHNWGITTNITIADSGMWTCPDGIYHAKVECWAAGGGGGSVMNSSPGISGGGGGGAYSRGNLVQTIPGPGGSYALVGSHGTVDNSGGNTTFGNLGGYPLVVAMGGAPGTENAGGQGGQAANGIGDVLFSGGNGAAGSSFSGPNLPIWSGPGGGGAGSTGNGQSAPPCYNSNGGGGTVQYGGGGGDGWEIWEGSLLSTATPGNWFGGGGAGAIGTGTNWPATSGADGLIRISY
jgi:uncharacterized repeat protein (TIGR03803 family)